MKRWEDRGARSRCPGLAKAASTCPTGSATPAYVLHLLVHGKPERIEGELADEPSIFEVMLGKGEPVKLFLERSDRWIAVTLRAPPVHRDWWRHGAAAPGAVKDRRDQEQVRAELGIRSTAGWIFGAGYRGRTGDIQLGKLTLYQLS